MTYEKNPYWYDADKVTVEKLEFVLSEDADEMYSSYKSGSVDLIASVPYDKVGALSGDPEFHVINELGTYYVTFNAKSPIFKGKTPEQAACMRLAFSMLIDRVRICGEILANGQIPASAFIPAGMSDGNGGLFNDPADEDGGYFDPEAINKDKNGTVAKAVELLEAAGYKFSGGKLSPETPIKLDYIINDSLGHQMIADEIKRDLAVVGIDITVKAQGWETFQKTRAAGNYDFARGGWIADYNDPQNMLEMWITDSVNNDCLFGR